MKLRFRPTTIQEAEDTAPRILTTPQSKPADALPGSITSSHLSLATSGGTQIAAYTTTTADSVYRTIASFDHYVPSNKTIGWYPASFQVKHSAAGASFSIAMYVYKGTLASPGALYANPMWHDAIYLATADQWFPMTCIGGVDFSIGSGASGPHAFYLAAALHTAGTLTIVKNSGYEFVGHYLFGT